MALGIGVSASVGYSVANSTTTSGITTQSSGSLLIVGGIWEANSTRPTISCSKSNTFATLGSVRRVNSGFDAHCGLWYKENAAGGSSHTFTLAKTGGYSSVFVLEVTGALTASSLDQNTGAADDTSSPLTSGTITTTQADEILIGFCGAACTANTAYTANNSFTKSQEITSNAFWQGCLSYRIVTATGTYEASTAVTNLTSGGILVASLKAAGGGGGGSPSPPFVLHW